MITLLFKIKRIDLIENNLVITREHKTGKTVKLVTLNGNGLLQVDYHESKKNICVDLKHHVENGNVYVLVKIVTEGSNDEVLNGFLRRSGSCFKILTITFNDLNVFIKTIERTIEYVFDGRKKVEEKSFFSKLKSFIFDIK